MNFKTGRSVFIVCTLLHETDLNEAREANQKMAQNGRETRKKLDSAKKLTAMLNFNNIGCQIGEDTLNVRLKMLQKKRDNESKMQQKKDDLYIEQKQKYAKIQTTINEKNIPVDSLTISQLKTLCAFKKRPKDKCSIYKLKRDELLSLSKQWMFRIDVDHNGDEQLPRKRQLNERDINNNGSQIETSDFTNQNWTASVPIHVHVPMPNSNVGIYEKNNPNNEDENQNENDEENYNYEVAIL